MELKPTLWRRVLGALFRFMETRANTYRPPSAPKHKP
jgi:hypothetical protein